MRPFDTVRSTPRISLLLVFAGLALSATGCGEKAASTAFESDFPGSNGGGDAKGETASTDASASPSSGTRSAPGTLAPPSADNSAERAIVEADVIQLDGDRLYALSRTAGLAVIDASNPGALSLLGRYRQLPGTPFEMYLRGDVAILMFTGWTEYQPTDDGEYAAVTTSKVLALDVANPNAIEQIGAFDVPGAISDSRIVGDIMYVVGREDGYCWGCDQGRPTTSVSSLSVADAHAIRKVDELRYADTTGEWSWESSVSVTNQRMYVAGPEYGKNGPIGSTIQVIDISDAGGQLVEGAVLQARGEISSRWQMDEYDGVLRVVSQSPRWQTTELPRLQTFKVISSQEFQPLAKLDVVIPARETLRSARFDGPRGYLITAEQKDPLFTLDLSDPANPRQVGELVLPGFVYHMEPRGDRLVGLGFDQNNQAGAIAVSLFDVSNLAKPKLLSRVNFGGTWAYLPEDQDRIHKVFRVLDDQGMILVPFMGYERSTIEEYCGKSVGGVQLIDYANDTLRRRGAAGSETEVRRALIHADHLLAVSDARVEAFSLADRDALALRSNVTLANTVRYAARLDGDVVARVVSPNWGQRYFVEIVSKDAAEEVNARLSEIGLDDVFGADASQCNEWWSIDSSHARGSRLYLSYSGYRSTDKWSNERETGVIVIDASDPRHPTIEGHKGWVESGDNAWNTYSGSFDYGGFGQNSTYLWHDDVLAFLEERYVPISANQSKTVTRLRVIDLRDPKALSATTIPLREDLTFSGLIADGDRILTSHFATPNQTVPAKVIFYADSFDISDPRTPKALGSVNIPGALVHYDRDSGRAITAQLHRVVVRGLSSQACYERFSRAEFEFDNPRTADSDSPGKCTGYTQSLHLVALGSDAAVLEDSLQLNESQHVAGWSAGDGRVFAVLGTPYGWGYGPGPAIDCFGPCGGGGSAAMKPLQVLVLGGFDSGELKIGTLKVESSDANAWRGFWSASQVYAAADTALLFGNGDAAIVDASDVEKPVIKSTVKVLGYPQSVEIKDGTALVALGEQGLQWFDL